MPHVSLKRLVALDGQELSPHDRARVMTHLESCVRCRSRLSGLRAIRERLSAATAPEAPDVLGRIFERIDGGEVLVLPVPDESAPLPSVRRRVPIGWVAGLALALGVGSAAAAVGGGEPVLQWIRDRLAGDRPAVERAFPAPVEAGIDVEIPAGGIVVQLDEAGPDLLLDIERTAGELLELVGSGEAAAARFRAGPDRVVVTGARRGELRIGVPRSAGPVRVVAGTVTLIVIESVGEPADDVSTVRIRLGDALRQPAPGSSR